MRHKTLKAYLHIKLLKKLFELNKFSKPNCYNYQLMLMKNTSF